MTVESDDVIAIAIAIARQRDWLKNLVAIFLTDKP